MLEVKAQYNIPNLLDHEITLDILAQDAEGKKFDVEVQRSSKGASPQRARYHLALMDARSLAKGRPYTELPENYVIFITEEDTRHKNKPISYIDRYHDDGEKFSDGSHIVYVNGAYQAEAGEETDLTKLIHDFRCTRPEDMQIEEIASEVHYYKRTEGGHRIMCRIMEELAAEERAKGREEGAENTLISSIKNLMESTKWTAEQAMNALKVPADQREKLAAKL